MALKWIIVNLHPNLRKVLQTKWNHVFLQKERQGSISSKFYEQLYMCRSWKHKIYSQVVSLFCAFGICACKSCSWTWNVDEIDPRSTRIGSLYYYVNSCQIKCFCFSSGADAINISGLLKPKKLGNFNNHML